MDLDIEMDDAVEVPQIPEAYTTDIITGGEEQEPGEVEESQPEDTQADERTVVPYKVHIRGLDTFNPAEVKAYVSEHFSSGQFDRVEWIDDVSANLIFKSESTAQEALLALAAVEIADATQLPPLESLPAKAFSGKPNSTLQVRFAVASDKKIAGAAARSRFYLLHPEYDPEERRRRGDFDRSKYRDRGDRGRDRDRRSGRRRDDRFEDESEPFDVSLYDDDEAALAKRAPVKSRSRRGSISSGDEDDYARRNRDKELFPNRRPRGSGVAGRDRSASPMRDDARMEMDDLAKDQEAAARNRDRARAIKDRLSRDIKPRDSTDNKSRELFPNKVSASAPASRAQMDQVDERTVLTSAKLEDRITPRTAAAAETGSMFNIRGTANRRGTDQGFAIKGTGASAKELFPEKFGNAGKELFADKVEGRGRRRQKAEDLFR